MKFSFELTIDDWLEFHKSYISQSKQVKRWKIGGMVSPLIGVALVLGYKLVADGQFDLIVLAIGLLLSAVWAYFYGKNYEQYLMKSSRKMIESGDNSSMLGIHEYELSGEHFVVKEPATEVKVNWTGIVKVDENDKYLFLYNTAITAFIIPKFKLEKDSEKIIQFVRSKT